MLPDPLVLNFPLGLAARLPRSDLKVPEALHEPLAPGFATPVVAFAVLRPEKFS